MRPTRLTHGDFQARIVHLLLTLLPAGREVTEAAAMTNENVQVPNVAWFSPEHRESARHELASSAAPAICVETVSDGNRRRELDVEISSKRS